jgi:molybdopterin-guanine dinucleotide biosynthesis protein A
VSDVSALILAGGKAARMGGAAKHALVVDGETILARQLRVLAPRCVEVIVALGLGAPTIAGVTCVHDATSGIGPLAGLAAGLGVARTPWCLIVACDMPDITAALVDRILAMRRDELDAVGVRVDGLVEPLLGAVRVATVRDHVDRLVAAGVHKASRLWDTAMRVAWIDDADPRALANVNSSADLRGR